MKKLFIFILSMATLPFLSNAQSDTVYVYGPGGPFGPINECAQIFSKHNNVIVKVTAGPEANWIDAATQNADIIYGGAEYMLTLFAMKYPGLIDNSTRTELYKRGAAILVKPGNPKKIKSLKDLTQKGIRILDVNGAGQFAMWEDLAGREDLIADIQQNIKKSFANTALGIAGWKSNEKYDAWITYASWHYRLKSVTQLIPLPKNCNVFRGTPVALTTSTQQKALSKGFIQFMQSKEGYATFKKWGWE